MEMREAPLQIMQPIRRAFRIISIQCTLRAHHNCKHAASGSIRGHSLYRLDKLPHGCIKRDDFDAHRISCVERAVRDNERYAILSWRKFNRSSFCADTVLD